jgi:aspartate aminotransferase-like enzyme
MYGLQASLNMMKNEGLESIFARHQRLTQATREAIKAMGLPLFASDEAASNAITAVAPLGVEAEKIRSVMRKRYDIALAGGQDHLSGKIFRMGHLGFVSDRDILAAISALEATLVELGYDGFTLGAGVAAAARVFAQA